MKKLVLILIFSPLCVFSQDHGIAFCQLTSWDAIATRAASEHKLIFIDCYATWCGPCKVMDKKVYTSDSVGLFMEEHFISVKIQMDSNANDGDNVREKYPIARILQKRYSVSAYPSFLFLSPDGSIVHEAIGAKNIGDFIGIAKAALDSSKQYFTLRKRYEKGMLKDVDLPYLACYSKALDFDSFGLKVASDYENHLPANSLWTMENLQVINNFPELMHCNEQLFNSFFRNRKLIDSIVHSADFAESKIRSVIYSDIVKRAIDKALQGHDEPKWDSIGKSIISNYGREFADENLLKGRVTYYEATKMWQKYATYLVVSGKHYDYEHCTPCLGAFMVVNNTAFTVFEYSNKRKELTTALAWANHALSMNTSLTPDAVDTKANLLYKLGKK